jgi:hypothetical protein
LLSAPSHPLNQPTTALTTVRGWLGACVRACRRRRGVPQRRRGAPSSACALLQDTAGAHRLVLLVTCATPSLSLSLSLSIYLYIYTYIRLSLCHGTQRVLHFLSMLQQELVDNASPTTQPTHSLSPLAHSLTHSHSLCLLTHSLPLSVHSLTPLTPLTHSTHSTHSLTHSLSLSPLPSHSTHSLTHSLP